MERVNIAYQGGNAADMINNYQIMTTIVSQSNLKHMDVSFDLSSMECRAVQKFVKTILRVNDEIEGLHNLIMTYSLILDGKKKWKHSISEIRKIMPKVFLKGATSDDDFIRSNYNAFSSMKVYCALLVNADNAKNALELYSHLSSYGAPVVVDHFDDYENLTVDDFNSWAFQTEGSGFSIFSDMLSNMLLDYWGNNCEHTSCLSRNYYISLDGGIFCCRHSAHPQICTIHEIKTIQDVMSCSTFIQILEKAIEYRETCKSDCAYYSICQGGCPLRIAPDNNICDYKAYCSLYNSILSIVKDIVKNVDYRKLNPAFRGIILSSAASNKLFTKCETV